MASIAHFFDDTVPTSRGFGHLGVVAVTRQEDVGVVRAVVPLSDEAADLLAADTAWGGPALGASAYPWPTVLVGGHGVTIVHEPEGDEATRRWNFRAAEAGGLVNERGEPTSPTDPTFAPVQDALHRASPGFACAVRATAILTERGHLTPADLVGFDARAVANAVTEFALPLEALPAPVLERVLDDRGAASLLLTHDGVAVLDRVRAVLPERQGPALWQAAVINDGRAYLAVPEAARDRALLLTALADPRAVDAGVLTAISAAEIDGTVALAALQATGDALAPLRERVPEVLESLCAEGTITEQVIIYLMAESPHLYCHVPDALNTDAVAAEAFLPLIDVALEREHPLGSDTLVAMVERVPASPMGADILAVTIQADLLTGEAGSRPLPAVDPVLLDAALAKVEGPAVSRHIGTLGDHAFACPALLGVLAGPAAPAVQPGADYPHLAAAYRQAVADRALAAMLCTEMDDPDHLADRIGIERNGGIAHVVLDGFPVGTVTLGAEGEPVHLTPHASTLHYPADLVHAATLEQAALVLANRQAVQPKEVDGATWRRVAGFGSANFGRLDLFEVERAGHVLGIVETGRHASAICGVGLEASAMRSWTLQEGAEHRLVHQGAQIDPSGSVAALVAAQVLQRRLALRAVSGNEPAVSDAGIAGMGASCASLLRRANPGAEIDL